MDTTSGDISHVVHVGSNIAIIKNGSQQHTNAPVIIANVLAALRSRFESTEFCGFFRTIDLVGCCCCMTDGVSDGYAIEMSFVGGSFSMFVRSTPLPQLTFSGLVFVDEIFVNAVVVSLIVGNGRPMMVTTAAAIPPDPPAADAMQFNPAVGCVVPVAVTFHRKPIAVSAIHDGFAKGSGWA